MVEEKGPNIASNTSPVTDHCSPGDIGRIKDAALDFLETHQSAIDPNLYKDQAYVRRLRRKVDFAVIPFLMLCYVMNFLDKTLLGYAQVMGLTPELKLRGNDFSNASSAFYIAVLIAMLPNIYLLQRLPVAKWLGVTLALWGVCTACHAAIHSYGGLLAARIFCGIFEAAVPSALMLLSSQWYTRSEQATRFSFWYGGMGLGQIFGGLFSWAFQHVSPDAPLSGWRLMFLIIGLFTVLLGIAIFFYVPDTPMQAWFLTDDEKVNLLEHVKANQTGIVTPQFQRYHIKEGLLDFQLWAMFLIVTLQGTGGGFITSYSATLLRSFGFSSSRAALLNMPTGAFNIASALSCGFASRYFGMRWLWTTMATCLGVLGAALMSWMKDNRSASLAGIYLANVIVGATPIDYQWITSNTAGHTKRAFVTAAMNAAMATGNIIGPQTFRAKDAPEYEPAKISLVGCWSASGLLAIILFMYYLLVNKWRDGRTMEPSTDPDDMSETKAFAGLTDKQNPEFRYNY